MNIEIEIEAIKSRLDSIEERGSLLAELMEVSKIVEDFAAREATLPSARLDELALRLDQFITLTNEKIDLMRKKYVKEKECSLSECPHPSACETAKKCPMINLHGE